MSDYSIELSVEEERGCGFRRSGKDGVGIYLRGEGEGETCERLPYPIGHCPTCGEGIHFSRGWTWIMQDLLLDGTPYCNRYLPHSSVVNPESDAKHSHDTCVMCHPEFAGERAGMLWVGEKFYTPEKFIAEGHSMGLSKRISAIPHGFEVGKTWVYLAHVKACKIKMLVDSNTLEGLNGPTKEVRKPGIFYVFRPTLVDLVVDTRDPDKLPARAKALKDKLGDDARLVKVFQSVRTSTPLTPLPLWA